MFSKKSIAITVAGLVAACALPAATEAARAHHSIRTATMAKSSMIAKSPITSSAKLRSAKATPMVIKSRKHSAKIIAPAHRLKHHKMVSKTSAHLSLKK